MNIKGNDKSDVSRSKIVLFNIELTTVSTKRISSLQICTADQFIYNWFVENTASIQLANLLTVNLNGFRIR
jgi:hypothetical protein